MKCINHSRICRQILTALIVIVIAGVIGGWLFYSLTPKQIARRTLKEGALSKDLLAKQSAIEALGELRDARFLPILKDALHDREWVIRTSAVKALGKIANPSTIPLLKESLFDKEWQVRYAAAQALATMGDTSGIQLLKQALK